MTRISASLRIVLPALLLGFALAAGAQQATSTSTTGAFEILAIQGNTIVVRNANGTQEHTVPSDFPFVVDGKTLTVSDLRVGMKGTATVTTRVTVVPVYVTEIRNGEVLSRIARTLVVKSEDGRTLRFTQTELDERGVQVYRDGKEIKVINLNPGDQLSARVVTRGTPEVLTEQQVAATLANQVEAPPTATAPEAPAEAGTTVADEAPVVDAAPVETTPVVAAAETPAPAPDPAPAPASSFNWMIALLAALALALVIFLTTRKRNDKAEAGK